MKEEDILAKWVAVLDTMYPNARGNVNSLMMKLDLPWLSVDSDGDTCFQSYKVKDK